jgi:hypothetical protein
VISNQLKKNVMEINKKNTLKLSKGNTFLINVNLYLKNYYKKYSIVTLVIGFFAIYISESSFLRNVGIMTIFFSIGSLLFCSILDRLNKFLVENPDFLTDEEDDELTERMIKKNGYNREEYMKELEKFYEPIDPDDL